jgi:excisionase family DNA binding protein
VIDESEQLLTKQEVCDWLKIDTNTLDRMRQRGELEAVIVGQKLVRFRRSDVLAILNPSTEGST